MLPGLVSLALILLQNPGPVPLPNDLIEADEKILLEAKVPTDGPELLRFLQDLTPDPGHLQEIQAEIQRLSHESFNERRQAFRRLASMRFAAATLLRQATTSPDPEIARSSQRLLQKLEQVPSDTLIPAAIRKLGRLAPEGALDWLISRLSTALTPSLMDAYCDALTFMAQRDPTVRHRLEPLLANPEPICRAVSGKAILNLQPDSPRVRNLLDDESALVRWYVGMHLARVGREKRAVVVLIDLLPVLPEAQGNAVDELLRHLAADTAPAMESGESAETKQRLRDAWRRWWVKHESEIVWERLDRGPAELGYTLVLRADFAGTSGEVVELGADGRSVRWRIGNLNLPIDAHYLPREQRVLIAEYNGNQVTERDLTGEIRQSWTITQPIMCQRLPNGSTLIASRNQILELDSRKQTVFALPRPAADIVAAGRTPEGIYVFITRGGTCEQYNAQGRKVRSFAVARPYHYGSIEILPNNRLLMTHSNGLAEYDLETGKQLAMISGYRTLTSVQRLKNGNTLVTSTSARRITELDRTGKVVREIVLENQIPWRAKRR